MIQTLIIKPNPLLEDCISHYAIREFDCSGADLLKPMCAKNEIHLMFLINSKMTAFKNIEGCKTPHHINPNSGPDCVYSGLLTSNKGSIVFSGHVKLLTIHFKPTGFFYLFNLSPAEITDVLGECYDLFSRPVLRFHEQLQEAGSNEEISRLTDCLFIDYLRQRKTKPHRLCLMKVTEFLSNQPGMYGIDELAYAANMSLKTFERRFVEQVGVNPKLFERLKRFNRAMDIKIGRPGTSWTEIYFLTGYYDQNHFIKEFVKFAGMPPASFFKISPPPVEDIRPAGVAN